ncbi:MAG: molybdopterin-dependent oxidoreductase [Chloroflexi bacterium]|nr:molybdopterin-dependent oxidoreductase [Chloroflexota bacterium]
MGPRARKFARAGLWAGLIAGAALALATVVLRLAIGAPSLQEVLSDRLLSITPGQLFDFLLERLRQFGKPLMFASLTVGLVPVGGAIGIAYGWTAARLRLRHAPLRQGMVLSVAVWLIASLAVVPLAGGGPFGVSVPGGALGFSAATFIASTVYGLVLATLHAQLAPRPQGEELASTPGSVAAVASSRRIFLKRAALWGLGLGALGSGVWAIVTRGSRIQPSHVDTRDEGVMPPEVTPNDRFYVISKNIVDPEVDASRWSLKVEGLVERPFTLAYEELKALPSVEQYVTLECISNPVGGELISNALWKGVPLGRLMERSGLKPGVKKLVFHAWDSYSDSIPVERALRPEVIVTYQMNGEPLPHKHGFPARLIAPGLYGVKNVKWLTRIEAVDHDYRGFWQEQGWSDTAEIKTTSQLIVTPEWGKVYTSPALLGGVAFAGDRGVSRVEVSTDGGNTWHEARLKPALSPFTWVLWTKEWLPPPGEHLVVVRAADGQGHFQSEAWRPTFPDGAEGYQKRLVIIQERPEQAG